MKDIGVLRTMQIINAMLATDRKDFIPEEIKEEAYIDEALPIGWGQTISQPYTVAFMLELLAPQPGETILDIGAGSGWQTAMLAYIVSNQQDQTPGKVYAIEIIPDLCKFGKANVSKYSFIKNGIVEFRCGDGDKPVVNNEEANKIIAAASISCDSANKSECLPENWKRELKIDGVIVTPIGNSIWKFKKISADQFEPEEYPGFVFVPYV